MSFRKILALTLAVAGLSFLYCNHDAFSQDKEKEKAKGHGHAAAMPNLPTGPTARPKDAKLYIISPKDGKKVGQKFTIRFGLKGMGVAPAATYLNAETPTGHHHLIIDAELPNMKLPFPKDDNYRHFGGGQTEAVIELPPGKHTLQLVLADHNHVPHDPPLVSEKITVTVE